LSGSGSPSSGSSLTRLTAVKMNLLRNPLAVSTVVVWRRSSVWVMCPMIAMCALVARAGAVLVLKTRARRRRTGDVLRPRDGEDLEVLLVPAHLRGEVSLGVPVRTVSRTANDAGLRASQPASRRVLGTSLVLDRVLEPEPWPSSAARTVLVALDALGLFRLGPNSELFDMLACAW
jgi:hypothetical protein